MSVYGLNTARFGTHHLIAREISTGNNVLDVGCNKGYMKILVPDNNFYGIDVEKADLQQAKKNGYKKVYKIDLNKYNSFTPDKKFDVIVFADILEHLSYPDEVLSYFIQNFLKKNGKVIISLPNVAHFSIRGNLLIGKFNYTQSGILDNTHLHLYTLKSARKLLTSNNLVIQKEKFSSNFFGRAIKNFPFLGTFLGFNLIFVCKKT